MSILTGCASTENGVESGPDTILFPFGGDLSSYEGKEILLQEPLFVKDGMEFTSADIRKLEFVGPEITQECKRIDVSIYTKSYGFQMTNLSFKFSMPPAGDYTFDEMVLTFQDGTEQRFALNHLRVHSISKGEYCSETFDKEGLSMKFFLGKQGNIRDRFVISYTNGGAEDIIIRQLLFSEGWFENQNVQAFGNYSCSQKLEDAVLHEGEEKVYQFSMTINEEAFSSGDFYWFQPMLIYEKNGEEWRMPAQHQPIIVEGDYQSALEELIG